MARVDVRLLLRYLLAVSLWLVIVSADLAFRILCVFFIPMVMIWSKFGLDYNQQSFQATHDLGYLFTRRWMRFPRLSLKRLLTRNGRAGAAADHGPADIEPFQNLGNRRI